MFELRESMNKATSWWFNFQIDRCVLKVVASIWVTGRPVHASDRVGEYT